MSSGKMFKSKVILVHIGICSDRRVPVCRHAKCRHQKLDKSQIELGLGLGIRVMVRIKVRNHQPNGFDTAIINIRSINILSITSPYRYVSNFLPVHSNIYLVSRISLHKNSHFLEDQVIMQIFVKMCLCTMHVEYIVVLW